MRIYDYRGQAKSDLYNYLGNRLTNPKVYDYVGTPMDEVVRFATWNIGHFSLGNSKNSSITSENYSTKLTDFKELINSVGAVFWGISEYSAIFGNDGTEDVPARTALFSDYVNSYIGEQANFSCDALFTNLSISNITEEEYECNQTAVITHTSVILATDYYYLLGYLLIDGESIPIIVTHLAFDNNNPEVCTDQIEELINIFDNESKIIIMGDFNVATPSEFDLFTNAGYQVANTGQYLTYSGQKALDNIVTKGLNIYNVGMMTTGLSDHYPLYADIAL